MRSFGGVVDGRCLLAPAGEERAPTIPPPAACHASPRIRDRAPCWPRSPTPNLAADPCSGTAKHLNVAAKCGYQTGYDVCAVVAENAVATLACANGYVITAINFASYGTPVTSLGCKGYETVSACSAANSVSFVTAACIGLQVCTVTASNTNFLGALGTGSAAPGGRQRRVELASGGDRTVHGVRAERSPPPTPPPTTPRASAPNSSPTHVA